MSQRKGECRSPHRRPSRHYPLSSLPDNVIRYDFAWTFPRSFHVSPFNSRNGYYRLDIIDPFSPARSSSTPPIKVFLRLLTPSRETKLQALLASSPAHPSNVLEPANNLAIARTILRYPFALLLTTPRILYQAYLLHYEKKLLVYPRPEPHVQGHESAWNPAEKDVLGIGVAIGWQVSGWAERRARRIIEEWARCRAAEIGCGLEIVFPDSRPNLATDKCDDEKLKLVITSSDPKLFTNLLSTPSARHFLILAPELLTHISSPEDFEAFFAPRARPSSHWIDRTTAFMRKRHQSFLFSHSLIAPFPDLAVFSDQHFLVSPKSSWWRQLVERLTVLLIVSMYYAADVAEEAILSGLGAKFVHSAEPWKVWERALRLQYRLAEEQGRADADIHGKEKVDSEVMRDGEKIGEDDWVDLRSVRY